MSNFQTIHSCYTHTFLPCPMVVGVMVKKETICIPDRGILSPLSMEPSPWLSLMYGLPQLQNRGVIVLFRPKTPSSSSSHSVLQCVYSMYVLVNQVMISQFRYQSMEGGRWDKWSPVCLYKHKIQSTLLCHRSEGWSHFFSLSLITNLQMFFW